MILHSGKVQPRDRNACGAKTRKGRSCKAKPVLHKGRCRMHGGLSTGPRTEEGRERVAEAQRLRWKRWHETQSDGPVDV